MYGYIYKITDLTNNKIYIGKHKYKKNDGIDKKYHGSGVIISKLFKERPNDFIEEIIFCAATEDELLYFEAYFIDHLNSLTPNGYNKNLSTEYRKQNNIKIKYKYKSKYTPEERRKRQINGGKKGSPKKKVQLEILSTGKTMIFDSKTDCMNFLHISPATFSKLVKGVKGKNKSKRSKYKIRIL